MPLKFDSALNLRKKLKKIIAVFVTAPNLLRTKIILKNANVARF